MADQDPVGLEDEEDISGNVPQDFEKMVLRKGWFVPADPDLSESSFVGYGRQLPGNLAR